MKDPLEEALEKAGVHLEKKDVNPVTQMVASGLGGIAGNIVGSRVLHLGGIGTAVVSLLGAVVGHIAVTYRVHLAPPRSRGDETPESPMAVSDRR